MGSAAIVAAIAAGGALGAVSRYLLVGWMLRLLGPGFPWGILLCNFVGSTAMGLLVALVFEHLGGSAVLRGFLLVGLLGGFTTFSSFSLDTLALLQRGEVAAALAYIGGSVLLSVVGCIAGYYGMKAVLA